MKTLLSSIGDAPLTKSSLSFHIPKQTSKKVCLVSISKFDNIGKTFSISLRFRKYAYQWLTIALQVLSITALKNGFLVGVGTNKHLYYRKSFDGHPWKKVPNSCCVKSIMQLKNGLIVGVGMRNRLWVRQNLFTRWSLRIPNSGYVTSITTGPRNKIIGIGTNKRIYMRHYLTSRWIGPLANSGKVIDVSYSSDGHLYGVGTNKRYCIVLYFATWPLVFVSWSNFALIISWQES